jgi:hypothetical protein
MSQEDATQDDKQKLPELAKEKLARVRQHLKDNRKVYYACGATGVVCFFGGKYFRRPIVIDFKPVINNVFAIWRKKFPQRTGFRLIALV